PTSSAGSSRPRSSPTTTSSRPGRWRRPRRRARSAWRARTTSWPTATWWSSASTSDRAPSPGFARGESRVGRCRARVVYAVDVVYSVDAVRSGGAWLHTETTGTGPPLVLVPGGGGDAEMYAEVVPLLATRFTVITYDRRGNSRSRLDDARVPVAVADQAADVVAVLDHHGIERAHVFGSSGGAVIALEVLARHSDRLLGAVVHEPPLVQVLPGSPEHRELDELRRIAETEGPVRGFVA